MSSAHVLLRWRVPLADRTQQRQFLSGLVRTLRVYSSPPTGMLGYYASRQLDPAQNLADAWFTAFALEDRANEIAAWIGAHVPVAHEVIRGDAILGDDLQWYRDRLRQVTELALEIPEDPQRAARKLLIRALHTLPDPAGGKAAPHGAYEERLAGPLRSLAPDAYERAIGSSETGSPFWIDFARWPHRDTDSLSPPGHWLWNLVL